MKITIELTEAEVKGVKEYLSDLEGRKANKGDIVQFIQGVVETTLQSSGEAVCSYIQKHSN
jgi:hypothetical protein